MPNKKAPCKCLSIIMLDSVIKAKKKYYPQTFLEEFCIYLLLAVLIFIYHSHNNLLLYLVSHIFLFDNKFSHSFFIYSKKIIKHLFLSIKLKIHYINCIIFAHIPKVISINTSFSINNSNIIKTDSFFR